MGPETSWLSTPFTIKAAAVKAARLAAPGVKLEVEVESLAELDEAKSARSRLEADFKKKQKQLDDQKSAIEKAQKEFEQQQAVLAPAAREAKQRDLMQKLESEALFSPVDDCAHRIQQRDEVRVGPVVVDDEAGVDRHGGAVRSHVLRVGVAAGTGGGLEQRDRGPRLAPWNSGVLRSRSAALLAPRKLGWWPWGGVGWRARS